MRGEESGAPGEPPAPENELSPEADETREDPQRLRERRARVILEEMYQFVALLDDRGNILEVNKPALDGVGYRLEEVVRRPLWEIECWQVTPETPERLKLEVLKAAREG